MNSFLRIIMLVFLFVSIMLITLPAIADNYLKVSVTGASPSLTRNINAHLGELPKSANQRRAYIFNAEDNIRSALHSVGYYHAKVNQSIERADKGPWTLIVDITPGEPTTIEWVDLQLKGEILNDVMVTNWLNQLTIKPGDVLNHGTYENVKSQLVTLALARGYFDGEYTQSNIVINRDRKRAQISLHYNSGIRYHIGDVSFEGHTLNDNILSELIPFESQIPYSTAKLGELNRELLDTNYFPSIKVLPQLDKINGVDVPVKVELLNRPSHSLELGVGAEIGNSTNDGIEPRIKVNLRTPQINRYGHSQESSIEWSPDRPKFLTTYTIPLSHPLDDQLKLRVGLLRDKYGVTQVYDPDKRDYTKTGELESTKMALGVIRQQRLKSNWVWTYSLEAMNESYTQSDTNYDPRFLLLGTSISKTKRGDNTLDPKSGFFQQYSIEYADPQLSSSVRLTRLAANFKVVETFFQKHRIVSRLDMAANVVAEEDLPFVPPSLRYFAGGDQSIRGYSYQELGPYIEYINDDGQLAREVVGGRYLLVGSIEYQYYVTPTWRVGTFVDAGNAFDVDQIEPIVSVGGGIHWISPIGPIKLDVGVGLKETDTVDRSWRIHITMGAEI
ncbi:autotransporter assembly complex protein TamA [Shewanella waksmanii]|uniref:autotransporter assembly complex protein TamA n=1 Tax=Shewanella waksmanii TaxID=213783 RepID=UPI0004BAFA27